MKISRLAIGIGIATCCLSSLAAERLDTQSPNFELKDRLMIDLIAEIEAELSQQNPHYQVIVGKTSILMKEGRYISKITPSQQEGLQATLRDLISRSLKHVPQGSWSSKLMLEFQSELTPESAQQR